LEASKAELKRENLGLAPAETKKRELEKAIVFYKEETKKTKSSLHLLQLKYEKEKQRMIETRGSFDDMTRKITMLQNKVKN